MPFRTPPLRVILSPDRIRIHDGTEEWSYVPAVWFDPTTRKTVGIGETAVAGAQYLTLFGATPLPAGVDRQWLLGGFFMKALGVAVMKVWLKVKPKVIVEGISTLSPLLGGYERGVVETALKAGGAMTVEFV